MHFAGDLEQFQTSVRRGNVHWSVDTEYFRVGIAAVHRDGLVPGSLDMQPSIRGRSREYWGVLTLSNWLVRINVIFSSERRALSSFVPPAWALKRTLYMSAPVPMMLTVLYSGCYRSRAPAFPQWRGIIALIALTRTERFLALVIQRESAVPAVPDRTA